MAGHSQFKNIMFRKGAQDKKRSKLFSKLAREITVAAKLGGPDPDSNARLRLAIQKARAQSMPKDNISRSISKAESNDSEQFEEMRYEGYGPNGVAVIVEALTDNKNRTASNVRATFSKHGGSLAETGAVSFMFDRVGEIEFVQDVCDEETALDCAIEAGAQDCISDEHGHLMICGFRDIHAVATELETMIGPPGEISIVWRAQNLVPLDAENTQGFLKFLQILEDDDDVQEVFFNASLDVEAINAA